MKTAITTVVILLTTIFAKAQEQKTLNTDYQMKVIRRWNDTTRFEYTGTVYVNYYVELEVPQDTICKKCGNYVLKVTKWIKRNTIVSANLHYVTCEYMYIFNSARDGLINSDGDDIIFQNLYDAMRLKEVGIGEYNLTRLVKANRSYLLIRDFHLPEKKIVAKKKVVKKKKK